MRLQRPLSTNQLRALGLIAEYGTASTAHLLALGWSCRGAQPSIAYPALRALRRYGFVDWRPLRGRRGQGGSRVWYLTPTGQLAALALGLSVPWRVGAQAWLLERTEVLLQRSTEGWRQVEAQQEIWQAIRTEALAPFRGRRLTQDDLPEERAIRHMTPTQVPFQAMMHPTLGFRFLVHSRPRWDVRKALEQLPTGKMLSTLRVEFGRGEPSTEESVVRALRWWATRHRRPVEVYTALPAARRGLPLLGPGPAVLVIRPGRRRRKKAAKQHHAV